MDDLAAQVEKNRRHIKYEAITFSLQELVGMHQNREIVIQPEYQRLFRWSREQQSSFIESLILEIPVPPLFFYERESDGVWELLDGLQRLSTVIRFMSGDDVPEEYRGAKSTGEDPNESDWHYDHQYELDKPLQLVEGEYLTALRGLTNVRLPTQFRLNLKRTRLNVYVLKRETHPSYKYEVFKRLNTGGAPLEEQEIRNSAVRLLGDAFPKFLEELGGNPDFVRATGLGVEKVRNKFIEELALRYLAMKNGLADFKHDVDEFLTRYMERVAEGKHPFNYLDERVLFERMTKLLVSHLPNGEGFRFKDAQGALHGPFSPTLFELVTVAIASNIEAAESLANADAQKFRDRVHALNLRARDDGLTGSGSNSLKKTRGRMQLAIGWFAEQAG